MATKIERIGVIGAGLIGAEWASFFAAKGMSVNLYDSNPSRVAEGILRAHGYLEFLSEHKMIDIDLWEAKSKITASNSIADAVSNVGFVQEAASETLEIKQAIFAEVDRHTSDEIVIASSSSAILMSDIQKVMNAPQRAVVAHPFNPAHLVPLVEIVPGVTTEVAIAAEAKQFFDKLGKIAIIINREIPGYVANRLQAALWREATDMVLRGVVSVEDVDKALYAGPGIRYAFMGQHLVYHLGGGAGGIEHFIDHIGARKKILWEDMAKWTELPAEAKSALKEGIEREMAGESMAVLEKRRDETLVNLLNAIYG